MKKLIFKREDISILNDNILDMLRGGEQTNSTCLSEPCPTSREFCINLTWCFELQEPCYTGTGTGSGGDSLKICPISNGQIQCMSEQITVCTCP